MTCLPLGTIGITPGTPAPISANAALLVAVLTVQAAPNTTGAVLIRHSGATIASVAPGATWSAPATGSNAIQPAAFEVDAPADATNAAAIVTAWTR
jgi:hypothetical protein